MARLSQPPLFHGFNPLNAELNPICHKLALLEAPYIYDISTLRVNDYHINQQVYV
jgi:hypothetical protein